MDSPLESYTQQPHVLCGDMEGSSDEGVPMTSWSDRILIVGLPPEPQTRSPIADVISLGASKLDCDVILDFSRVDTVMEGTIRRIMEARRLLAQGGHRLVLCNASGSAASTLNRCNSGDFLHIAKTSEIALAPPMAEQNEGLLVLAGSNGVTRYERRKCVRVRVAGTCGANVVAWYGSDGPMNVPDRHWRGQLVDISDGGARVVFDGADCPDGGEETMLYLKFSNANVDESATLECQIRGTLPTADGGSVCLGLKFVEFDLNGPGRLVLKRLCDLHTRYYEATRSAT